MHKIEMQLGKLVLLKKNIILNSCARFLAATILNEIHEMILQMSFDYLHTMNWSY